MKLVGRDGEIAGVREACLRARDGRGQVIVVSGEAGLGKSALVDAVATELASTFDVTWGRAWELADAPAYFPLWPCLKSLGVAVDATRAESGTFELWERVLDALVQASAKRPVMWAIDDVHVADIQTLDLLCFLAQAIRALPVVLIATTRAQDPRLDERAQQRIVRLIRDGREVRLHPLGQADVATLATHWLDRAPSTAELAQLVERTGGNPLFVVECARAGKTDAVPTTVAVVVGERVALLPDTTRRLVADAAVLGNEFTAAALAAVAGVLPARAIDDLAPALKAGIVIELAPGRFRFSHALVRDAIEAAMPDARAAHARALAAIEDTPEHAIERARHALAARAPNVELIVVGAIVRLELQGTFDRAFALWCQLDALRASGEVPAGKLLGLAHGASLALNAGKFAQHRELALRAIECARDAKQHALSSLVLGADTHPGRIDSELVSHLETALARLGDDDPRLRCNVRARLAAALQPAPDGRVPIEMARAAIAEARTLGDPQALAEVLFVAISALTDYVDVAELRDLNREHLDLLLTMDNVAHTLRAYARLILAEGELGDFVAQDQHLDQMMQLATRAGHPRLTWRPLLLASMRAIARGQFAESERYITEVERAAQLTDDPSLMRSFHAHKHMRALALHREKTVAKGLDELEASMTALPSGHWLVPTIRGLAAARLGDAAGAERAIASIAFEPLLAHRATASHVAMFGEICAAAGNTALCAQVLPRIRPYADRHLYTGHTPLVYEGPVRRVIGLIELALGNREAGHQHLRRALEQCRALGFATWVARISFELGDLEEAGRLATNLGIRGLARRAHASPTEPAAPPTRPSLGMSREGDVWRISYGIRVARISDSRGMELIAKLVERPGEEMHVLVLAGTGGDALTESNAGDALDERAARSYRDRLTALREELATAEANHDRGRIQHLSHERDFLEGELSRAFGLSAARKTGSISERARVNVQRRIKDSLARIGQHDSVIADYLRGAIRTGTYCTFRP